LGGIDILVNNAGTYETAAFDDVTVRQWDAIFATNVRGPFLVSQAALKYLRKAKEGGLSIWDRSADCEPGPRMLTIVRPRPHCTC